MKQDQNYMHKLEVILKEERHPDCYYFLGAHLNENGDLVFIGQDLGDCVERTLGVREYEWHWTIKASNLILLQTALLKEGHILDLLFEQFNNEKSSLLHQFLLDNSIPFETWSRLGD